MGIAMPMGAVPSQCHQSAVGVRGEGAGRYANDNVAPRLRPQNLNRRHKLLHGRLFRINYEFAAILGAPPGSSIFAACRRLSLLKAVRICLAALGVAFLCLPRFRLV